MQFALSEILLLWRTGSCDSFQLDFFLRKIKIKTKQGRQLDYDITKHKWWPLLHILHRRGYFTRSKN